MTNCGHCGSPFSPPRANAKYCGDRCKKAAQNLRHRSKAETKSKRLERDREKAGVLPKDYRAIDAESVTAKFGFIKVAAPISDEWDF